VGRTPWSAADALVGLLLKSTKRKAGPGGPARTRGSAPQGIFNRAVAFGFSYVYRPPTAVRRYFVERSNLDCYSRTVDTERPNDRMRPRQTASGIFGGHRSGMSGILIGAVIVIIGLMLLLDNMGVVRIYDAWRFWPIILVVVGVSKVLEGRSPATYVWGGMMALVGALLLLNNLHILIFDFDLGSLIWPLLVIGFGVTMLLKALDRRRYLDGRPPMASSNPGLAGAWAVFSSVKRRIDDQDFKGGDVVAVFGEVKIDLRKAGIASGEAVIDVNAMFAGVDIRVPETWLVVLKGAGVFGAFEDKTIPPRTDPGVKPPTLVITGTAVFGATKVDN
jgi:predicted membrane protein